MVSQYVIAYLEECVNSTVIKKKKNMPVSIIMAAYQKLIDKKDYANAISIL